MLAAFQICSSACSSEYCTKGCLLLRSFKNFLGLVPKICRASYTHGVLSFRCRMILWTLTFSSKWRCSGTLWLYCTDVISSWPMSLMMCSIGMTLDSCGFQQSFPRIQVLMWHLPLNSGNAIYASLLPWLAAWTCSIRHAFKEYDQNM